jgi:hypothetical protein
VGDVVVGCAASIHAKCKRIPALRKGMLLTFRQPSQCTACTSHDVKIAKTAVDARCQFSGPSTPEVGEDEQAWHSMILVILATLVTANRDSL